MAPDGQPKPSSGIPIVPNETRREATRFLSGTLKRMTKILRRLGKPGARRRALGRFIFLPA